MFLIDSKRTFFYFLSLPDTFTGIVLDDCRKNSFQTPKRRNYYTTQPFDTQVHLLLYPIKEADSPAHGGLMVQRAQGKDVNRKQFTVVFFFFFFFDISQPNIPGPHGHVKTQTF